MANTDFGRRYFSRPPQKSLYIWLHTLSLLALISLALVIGSRFYSRLSPSVLGWMCFSAVAPAILWLRAWQAHAKLYEINLGSRGSELEDQKRLDVALTEAAYLENTGMGIALFVLMTALMGFLRVLAK